ncbi:Secreted protein, containing von Willebrand factor (VWF) type A domain [Pseudoalteromonas luteoviolacea B = ATCC 29581]|nr:Secreted protein, containing von Willebrand factor (VWF) type A domain [Pseudoalteromonas luteoviolacea B = ATCC 29581]
MRRIARAPVEIFTLSFLDIISCAFAAVVMLVLLAKNGEGERQTPVVAIDTLIANTQQVNETIADLNKQLGTLQKTLLTMQSHQSRIVEDQAKASGASNRAESTLSQLVHQELELKKEIKQQQARLNVKSPPIEQASSVGGIPTDAEYVIFVIDNSGSMSANGQWKNVVSVVADILKNHPKMKGFQIMAADGEHMYSAQEGKWLNDSPAFRQKVISRLTSFTGGASAPEEGIKKALRLYKKEQGKVSLYVFGDDYRPGTLDSVVNEITLLNRTLDGRPQMRIHGVGFYRPRDGDAAQFSAFMQAVAKRNRGAFIGLDF